MNICRQCKHVQRNGTDICLSCYVCKKHKIINPITGYYYYEDCTTYNKHGDCIDFEQRKSFFERLVEKLNKL